VRRIVWADEARADVREAVGYIAADSPAAARVVRQRINDAVALLAGMPVGYPGRVKGTYEKPVRKTSYIIAYALSDHAITIVHVIHDRRAWPEDAWPEAD
jgi:plasmid stabilization system protein ParE